MRALVVVAALSFSSAGCVALENLAMDLRDVESTWNLSTYEKRRVDGGRLDVTYEKEELTLRQKAAADVAQAAAHILSSMH